MSFALCHKVPIGNEATRSRLNSWNGLRNGPWCSLFLEERESSSLVMFLFSEKLAVFYNALMIFVIVNNKVLPVGYIMCCDPSTGMSIDKFLFSLYKNEL